MNPQQPIEPQPPVNQPTMPAAASKSRTKLALFLMITPSALIVAALVLAALLRLAFEGSSDGNLFGDQSLVQTIANIILFLAGLVGVVTWAPGLVIGIIILVKQKK